MKSCKKNPSKKSSPKRVIDSKAKDLAVSLRALSVSSGYPGGNLWSGLPYRRVIE
jgi:hypothetical protein